MPEVDSASTLMRETINGIDIAYRLDMITFLPVDGEDTVAVTSRNLTAFAVERDQFAAGVGGRAFFDAFNIAQYATKLGVTKAAFRSEFRPKSRQGWGLRIEAMPGLLAYYMATYPESRKPVSDGLCLKNTFMDFGKVLLGKVTT